MQLILYYAQNEKKKSFLTFLMIIITNYTCFNFFFRFLHCGVATDKLMQKETLHKLYIGHKNTVT